MSGGKIEGNKCPEDGGGIYNLGTLRLTDVSVASNAANHAGAGIWSSGSATLTKTLITQSTNALDGGGVYNNGKMTIDSCAISGNSVRGLGGGVMLASDAQTSSLCCCPFRSQRPYRQAYVSTCRRRKPSILKLCFSREENRPRKKTILHPNRRGRLLRDTRGPTKKRQSRWAATGSAVKCRS